MKKNSLFGKFKLALTTVALSAAVFAFAPFSAFAAMGDISYANETVEVGDLGSTTLATEYSINGGVTWLPIFNTSASSTLDISSIIPAPGKPALTLILRANSTVTNDEILTTTAGKSKRITIPARPKASGLIYLSAKGVFNNANATTFDATVVSSLNKFTVAGGNTPDTKIFAPTTTTVVKYTIDKTGDTVFKSAEATLTVPAAPKAPVATFDAKTNTLLKTTTAMEYCLDTTGTTWAKCSNGFTDLSSIIVDAAKVHAVRMAATISSPASLPTIFDPTAVSPAIPALTTDFTIDWSTERMKNATGKAVEVSTNDGLTWTDVPTTTGTPGYSLTAIMKPYSATTNLTSKVWIRSKYIVASSTPASKILKYTISERPNTPAATVLTVDYTAGVKLDPLYSYTVSPNTATSTWKPGTSATVAETLTSLATKVNGGNDINGKTLDIRLAAVPGAVASGTASIVPASLPVKFKLAAIPAAPAVAYTGLKGGTYGALTGVKTGVSYSANSDMTSPLGNATTAIAEVLDLASGAEGKDIYVQTAATPTSPASAIKVIKVPNKPVAPGGTISPDIYNCAILGANTTMEIKLSTDTAETAWKVYTPANLKTMFGTKYDSAARAFATGAGAVKVDCRIKATALAPLSNSTQLTFN